MTSGNALIGSPGAEAAAQGAVEGEAVGLVGTDGKGDVGEGADVLEAVAQGNLIVAVAGIAADRGLGVDEGVGLAEVGGGGQLPAVEVAGDAVGGLADVAHFEVVAEEAGRSGGREGGSRTEGEETEEGEALHRVEGTSI